MANKGVDIIHDAHTYPTFYPLFFRTRTTVFLPTLCPTLCPALLDTILTISPYTLLHLTSFPIFYPSIPTLLPTYLVGTYISYSTPLAVTYLG